jgi:hypothetical protein
VARVYGVEHPDFAGLDLLPHLVVERAARLVLVKLRFDPVTVTDSAVPMLTFTASQF